MNMRQASIRVISALIIFACLVATGRADNVALNKSYAYFVNPPGQGSVHYRDDFTIHGLHPVHLVDQGIAYRDGLGVFAPGDLTDGEIHTAGGVGGNFTRVLGIRGAGNAPPAEIVFDLETTLLIEEVIIGTNVAAGLNNNAPDNVTISFSTTGLDAADFGGPLDFDLEGSFGPLADGHHDLPMTIPNVSARYVKLAFDGGSMAEPNGSDPNEKYMFDEITINANPIPEPSTFFLAALGLLGLLGWGRRKRRRAA